MRKKRTNRTPELEKAVVDAYEQGLSLRETQEFLAKEGKEISLAMVRNIIDNYGLLRSRGRSLGETRIKTKSTDSIATDKVTVLSNENDDNLSEQIINLTQEIQELKTLIYELKECLLQVFENELTVNDVDDEPSEEELENIEKEIKKIKIKKEEIDDDCLGEDIYDIQRNRKKKDEFNYDDEFDDDYNDEDEFDYDN